MDELGNLRRAKALSHPTRIRILMAMNAPRRAISPKAFSEETEIALGNASYHFRKLQQLGFIELIDTAQRRGATEHFYEPIQRALAWTEESKAIPPAILDGFSATVLRGFVEEAGESIDSGLFNRREDRALAWDKMWVDEKGWTELMQLWGATLTKAMAIEEGCAERRAKGVTGFYSSYILAAFESPSPPPPPIELKSKRRKRA